MHIIILGAGKIGNSLASHLAAENHSITLVDLNVELLDNIQSQIDIRTLCGYGSHPSVLAEAGADTANMLIAVTNNNEVNWVACQIAHSLFHTPIKIARIAEPDYLNYKSRLFNGDNLPIDFLINPQQQVTRSILNLIETPGSLQVCDFFNNKIRLIIARLFYGSELEGKKVGEIANILNIPIKIVSIFRDDQHLEMNDSLQLETNDDIYFVIENQHSFTMIKALRKISVPTYKKIMIAGGGQIGSQLAASLEGRYDVKIIENNRSRCEWLADHLKNTVVLCGNCCDQSLLRNEDIEEVDIFCALTNDDEDNIIACLQAKRLGAKQTFALVNRSEYIELITDKTININVAISPQQSTVGQVLSYIRRGDIANMYTFRQGNAEALELIVHGGKQQSKLIGKEINQIVFPKGIEIGAVARSGKIFIGQNTVIEENDHLIFFVADKKKIVQLEDFVNL